MTLAADAAFAHLNVTLMGDPGRRPGRNLQVRRPTGQASEPGHVRNRVYWHDPYGVAAGRRSRSSDGTCPVLLIEIDDEAIVACRVESHDVGSTVVVEISNLNRIEPRTNCR
jgi:hypothetical protein